MMGRLICALVGRHALPPLQPGQPFRTCRRCEVRVWERPAGPRG